LVTLPAVVLTMCWGSTWLPVASTWSMVRP
jgi:hypothetical protein